MAWPSKGAFVLVGVLLLGPLAAGCLGGEDPEGDPVAPTAAEETTAGAVDAWNGTDRLTIVDHRVGGGFESDVLCTGGGGPQLPRNMTPIARGTDHLEITVGIDATSTGIQVGYVVDGTDADYATGEEKEITWLPSVPPGMEETFTVDVAEDEVETNGTRWSFYYQLNPGAEELCYTGALVLGERWTTVEAVRG